MVSLYLNLTLNFIHWVNFTTLNQNLASLSKSPLSPKALLRDKERLLVHFAQNPSEPDCESRHLIAYRQPRMLSGISGAHMAHGSQPYAQLSLFHGRLFRSASDFHFQLGSCPNDQKKNPTPWVESGNPKRAAS